MKRNRHKQGQHEGKYKEDSHASNSSLGVVSPGFDDADEMIRKLEMRGLNIDLRHMAGSAIFVGDGATRLGALCGRFAFHSMTVQTLRVIVRCILF